MSQRSSTIPHEISSLCVPDIERVVLAGSGVLELAGIRPAADIDLATSRTNVDFLLQSDPERWHKKVHSFNRIRDGSAFQRTSLADTAERFDIWQSWYHAGRPVGDRLVTVDELIENSWQHKAGFYVVNTVFMMEMKAWAARPKDIRDVRRYEQWRENGY